MFFPKYEHAVNAYSASELLNIPFALVRIISSLSLIAGQRIWSTPAVIE
jgi:hypothetical protein